MRILPGEKDLLKDAKKEITEKWGNQPDEQAHQYRRRKKQIHKKLVRKYRTAAILGFFGVASIIGTSKLIEGESTQSVEQEQQKDNSFKETLHVPEGELIGNNTNQTQESRLDKEIEKKINELESKEDLMKFIKDTYLEKYEEVTGDDTLTTADIKIIKNNQNYVFYNKETEDYITHGEYPDQTMQVLQENNVSYDTIDNVDVYQVYDKNDSVIDCMTIQSKNGKPRYIRVVPGETFNEMKNYKSTLTKIGEIIVDGLRYELVFDEPNNETVKEQLIQDVQILEEKKQENKQKNTQENITKEGNEIGD